MHWLTIALTVFPVKEVSPGRITRDTRRQVSTKPLTLCRFPNERFYRQSLIEHENAFKL